MAPLPPLLRWFLPLLTTGLLLAGCDRESGPDLTAEANRLKGELDLATRQLATAGKTIEANAADLALANDALAKVTAQLAEKNQALTQIDAQLRALQTELDALKKRDAFVFAEITALRRQGLFVSALSQYQKFVADHPQSPLAPLATSAIAELTAERTRDAQKFAAPERQAQALLKNFGDGQTTLAELTPVLKNKALAQVVKILGRPDRSFNEGTEIGYTDKVLNPATGRPGLLIIGFDAGTVAHLRIEYSGRKIVP